jgi:hypothetical protein
LEVCGQVYVPTVLPLGGKSALYPLDKRMGQLKKSNDFVGNRTHDLLACAPSNSTIACSFTLKVLTLIRPIFLLEACLMTSCHSWPNLHKSRMWVRVSVCNLFSFLNNTNMKVMIANLLLIDYVFSFFSQLSSCSRAPLHFIETNGLLPCSLELSILCQINSLHINIIHHLRLGLPSCIFPSGFEPKPYKHFFFFLLFVLHALSNSCSLISSF